jgi:hypothetical protein
MIAGSITPSLARVPPSCGLASGAERASLRSIIVEPVAVIRGSKIRA